jgi:hypothetical protein
MSKRISKADKAAQAAVNAYRAECQFRNGRNPRVTISHCLALSGKVLVHDCDRPDVFSVEFDSRDAASAVCR